jgi:hypothetical protein
VQDFYCFYERGKHLLELLSNTNMMRRFLYFAALAPVVMGFVTQAEAQGGKGEDKKKKVMEALQKTIQILVGSGILPWEASQGAEAEASNLVDTLVRVHNDAGFFKTKKKEEEKPKAEKPLSKSERTETEPSTEQEQPANY